MDLDFLRERHLRCYYIKGRPLQMYPYKENYYDYYDEGYGYLNQETAILPLVEAALDYMRKNLQECQEVIDRCQRRLPDVTDPVEKKRMQHRLWHAQEGEERVLEYMEILEEVIERRQSLENFKRRIAQDDF